MLADTPGVDPTQKPWEQQPDENEKAYAAFLIYRDLPPTERTPGNAYALYRGWPGKFPPGTPAPRVSGPFHRWLKGFHWQERAAAWDRHLFGIHDTAAAASAASAGASWGERILALREKSWHEALQGLSNCHTLLRLPLETGTLNPWALQALAAALNGYDRLARLSCGIETDRKAAEVSGPGGAPVEQEVTLVPRHDLLVRNLEELTDEELLDAAATAAADYGLARLLGDVPGDEEPPAGREP
jgi:hypothetical protein